jgi:hypothetical protein
MAIKKLGKSITLASKRAREFAQMIRAYQQATIKIPNIKLSSKRKKTNYNTNLSYQIAIPTYQRPDIIQHKTLALLHQHNINPKLITLFVANDTEAELYKSKVPSNLYGKIVIGEKGLKNQRNFISRYYPEGTMVVEFDDDVAKIVELVVVTKKSKKNDKSLKPISNLDVFIKNAFDMCRKNNIFLWGVYPLANAHFMTDTVTTDLRFIVGPMWGMINRHRNDLLLTIDEKENSERTLQFWTADKTVLRFNNVAIETAYYKNKGGMQAEGKNRRDEALKSAIYLHGKYPDLTKIYLGKKSGVPEVRLLRTKKKN